MISNSQALATRPDGTDLFKLRDWYRRQYLKTVWWEERRHRSLELACYKCEACDDTGALHVHHLSYHHLFGEPNEDLMCLCNRCHKIAHEEDFEKQTRNLSVKDKRKKIISFCRSKTSGIPSFKISLTSLSRRRRK